MSKPNELYLVWVGAEDEQYYNQYFTLEDAVRDNDSDTEIFKAEVESLGYFEVVTKLVSKKKKGKK